MKCSKVGTELHCVGGERKALTAHINIIRHFDIIKSAGSDRKELKKKLPYDFLFYSSFFKNFFYFFFFFFFYCRCCYFFFISFVVLETFLLWADEEGHIAVEAAAEEEEEEEEEEEKAEEEAAAEEEEAKPSFSFNSEWWQRPIKYRNRRTLRPI